MRTVRSGPLRAMTSDGARLQPLSQAEPPLRGASAASCVMRRLGRCQKAIPGHPRQRPGAWTYPTFRAHAEKSASRSVCCWHQQNYTVMKRISFRA
jgi:hypothetical protein